MSYERRVLYWVAVAALLIAGLYFLSPVLLPFVAGLGVAYVLDPPADRLVRLGLSRPAAAAILTVGFVIALLALIVLLVPIVEQQAVAFAKNLPGYIDSLREQALRAVTAVKGSIPPEDVAKIQAELGAAAGKLAAWLIAGLAAIFGGGVAVLNIVALIAITPVVIFYMLRDWPLIVARVDAWLPRRQAPAIRETASEINRRLAGFARGQAIVCLILAVYYAAALSLVGLDFGLVIGLLIGIISFIPIVGVVIGAILSIGLAAAQFGAWFEIGLVTALFIGAHVVDQNFLTPRLVGDRIGLHPVWLIFAMLAGGELFGAVGVLLAVPGAAAAGVLAERLIARYLASPLYHDEDAT
jgi:predicted PurR-regulated permease PerM